MLTRNHPGRALPPPQSSRLPEIRPGNLVSSAFGAGNNSQSPSVRNSCRKVSHPSATRELPRRTSRFSNLLLPAERDTTELSVETTRVKPPRCQQEPIAGKAWTRLQPTAKQMEANIL